MTQLQGKIKNQTKVDELLAQGWTINLDQEFNPGQLDSPDDDITWYDAETDTFHN